MMNLSFRLCVDAIVAAGLLAAGDVRPPAGDEKGPRYEVVDLVGWQSQGLMSGPGLQGRGGGAYPVVGRGGEVYTQNRTVVRCWDPKTRRVEVIAGCGVPGFFDAPADLARFDIDTYSGGGMEISADGKTLYLMDQQARGGAIRVVDLQKRRVWTLAAGRIGRGTRRTVICLAMDEKGTLYAGGRSGIFRVSRSGAVRDLGCEGITSSQLCIEVDRKRGRIYGMDRTNPANFFSWRITGGPRTLLAGKALDPKPQYTSDGPVRRMWLKCPSGMRMDPQGFLVIGGGDSRTFRRIDLDEMEVRSLCGPKDKYDGTGRFTWDHGDGKRNRGGGFPTWVSYPGFDRQGNIYFGWSVWPKLVMLKRVDREAKP